jgi:hypothetical protein
MNAKMAGSDIIKNKMVGRHVLQLLLWVKVQGSIHHIRKFQTMHANL